MHAEGGIHGEGDGDNASDSDISEQDLNEVARDTTQASTFAFSIMSPKNAEM